MSFYDGRPDDHLIALLRQLKRSQSRDTFEVRLVVNSVLGKAPVLPADISDVNVCIRANTGFNIGAWDHGWRQNPGFSRYIFLQDECEIVSERWHSAYQRKLSGQNVGLVCESLVFWESWEHFRALWPEAYNQCSSLQSSRAIPIGNTPTHAQTLALAASSACLEATDGFCVAEDKVAAIATEIMFSRHCVAQRFRIVQSAWRPFEYFRHPQWASMRDAAAGPRWHLSRLRTQLSSL